MGRAALDEALVYALNAVFYKDVQSGNRELAALVDAPWARICATVDPSRPGALDDLRECLGDLNACAVRLFPGYHGYAIGDPAVLRFLEDLQEARPGLPVGRSDYECDGQA